MGNVPLSGTDIRLLKGIPFSSDKKHTRWFDSVNEQTTYFSSKSAVHTIANANFQRVGNVTVLSVNKSVDHLYGTNYVMFRNEEYNKWFYGFVERLEYVQKNTTYVHVKLDVFQTWHFHAIMNPSLVIREHRPQYYTDGRPVLNTIDEGLDYGSEYETMSIEKYQPNGANLFLVIVTKSVIHDDVSEEIKQNEIHPTFNAVPQPLSYYIHPFNLGSGNIPKINVGGDSEELTPILATIKSASEQEGTVNNIVSMYITEDIGIGSYDEKTDTFNFSSATVKKVRVQSLGGNAQQIITLYVKNHSSYNQTTNTFIPDKYSDFKAVKESKLLMYPYTSILLDDFKGNRMELKPELIQSTDIKIRTIGSLGLSNKVSYQVADYLYRDYDNIHGSHLIGLESGVINQTPQDIPVISDMLSAYLQGNRNSLATQQSQIMYNGLTNAVGTVMGAPTGSKMGAVTELASGVGSTVLELQALQSKKQDISNTPPTIAKMGSNTAFDFGNKITGVYIVKKQITQEYINKLTAFFNMYGYKTEEVKIPNFHTRKYWNYVQTSDCVIRGNIASEDLNELKGIYDNGITFWHTDEIGAYNLNNEVL